VAAVEVMTVSKNPRVQYLAKKLMARMRMVKMRGAAKFAGSVAVKQKQLRYEEEGWNSGAGRGGGGGGGGGSDGEDDY